MAGVHPCGWMTMSGSQLGRDSVIMYSISSIASSTGKAGCAALSGAMLGYRLDAHHSIKDISSSYLRYGRCVFAPASTPNPARQSFTTSAWGSSGGIASLIPRAAAISPLDGQISFLH